MYNSVHLCICIGSECVCVSESSTYCGVWLLQEGTSCSTSPSHTSGGYRWRCCSVIQVSHEGGGTCHQPPPLGRASTPWQKKKVEANLWTSFKLHVHTHSAVRRVLPWRCRSLLSSWCSSSCHSSPGDRCTSLRSSTPPAAQKQITVTHTLKYKYKLAITHNSTTLEALRISRSEVSNSWPATSFYMAHEH